MTTDATITPFRSNRGHSSRDHTGRREPTKSLSAEHKLALAAGRDESRAVRRYLEALHALGSRPFLDRRESMAKRIEEIDAQLAKVEPAIKVRLIQERMDLYAQLKAGSEKGSLDQLEEDFVSVASGYSARKGISYAAWREVGVGEAVLERAGIARPADPTRPAHSR